ncbi:MAG: Ribosomal protein S12 methylthiotransferase RimO [Lentisphaerae bacterium ADurb.BinA184]|nr:MAG: Ribosomal protein S12 methylthiotransferase RimO [Lentisphaerae bacterium ADurb.BinA184]
MNVLLISPKHPATFWSFKYALRFVGRRTAFPPLGLLTVAALLPKEWRLRLVDLNVRPLRRRDLEWASLALISAMTVQRASAREALQRCREAGVRTVAGGPLFTCEPEHFPEADHLVLNEAEVTLPRFLADLAAGSPQRVYTSAEFPDIRSTPAPRWDLANLRHYASMSVQYSRGCPFNCDFCSVTALFGHRPRTKTPAQVIAELDLLWARGWRGNVFFVDDNLLGNKAALKRELLPALIEWQRRHGLPFNTEASINLADDEKLMAMMVRAGFDTVFVGIETSDEASLSECGKEQNRHRDLVADVRRMQRAGLQVQGGFIVGFDHDTAETFQKQIDFIQASGIPTAMVGLLEAVPGTRLYDRLKREKRLSETDSTGDNADGRTNIITRMNTEALRDGYRRLMQHLYAPRQYYRRVRTLLREYRTPHVRMSVSIPRLLALGRSTVHLGVVGRERFHYWRLMLWTSLHRPRLLPTAVTLSIYGHHFRRMSQEHLR